MSTQSLKSIALPIALFATLALTAVSCKTAPVNNGAENATANGANDTTKGSEPAPGVVDKDNKTDPCGSDCGKIAGLNTVYFEYDQARLTNDTRKKLSDNAEWIKTHPDFTIQVEGHTDSRGSVEYNLALGERRAKSVKSFLESQGIAAKRITIISYGKEKPVDQGDGESAWSKNRRANFVPIQ